MTAPVTVEEERGQEEEAQPPAFEGEEMEAVRAYMLQLLTEGRGEQAIEMLLGLLGRLREEHSATAVRLKQALRQLYGRRSEKTPASQLQLLLSFLTQQQSAEPAAVPATADGAQAAAPAAPPADAPKKTPRRQPLRGAQALPAHLERREVLVPPTAEECICPGCGEQRKPMGEEVSQRLELEPARFYVRVEKRPKLGCQRCKEGVAAAPAGETPLPGALPGPGLLAQLLVGKYRDGLPLHLHPRLEWQGPPRGAGRLPGLPGGGRLQGLRGPLRLQLSPDRSGLLDACPARLRARLCSWRCPRRRSADTRPEAVRRGAAGPGGGTLPRGAPRPAPCAQPARLRGALRPARGVGPHVPAKTPLGKAIAYARNRAVPLGRFLEDGHLPVDNGEVERLIKLIVLGRKNWLFLGSDAAGHRAASVYSLVLSCYRLGMDPWAYFRDVLPKLGDTRFPAARLAELLPESWAQQQAQQR
jgi:transposase